MSSLAAHRTRRRLVRLAAGWSDAPPARPEAAGATKRAGLRSTPMWMLRRFDRRPRLAVTSVVGFGLGVGALTGGPVAALVVATYAGVGATGFLRRRRERAREADRVAGLDAVCALAADLRAGLPPEPVLRRSLLALQHSPATAAAVTAAWQVSERTGAPLADVLDRVEAQLRTGDRARRTASAQTAGARATALLLAALPLGGIALGYGIGVDPLHLLLRTPLGAASAGLAVALQIGGLAWAARLSKVDVP